MQGVRFHQAQNDENGVYNAGGIKSFGKINNDENGSSYGLGTGFGTPMTSSKPTTRRALGNITNQGLKSSQILAGKTPLETLHPNKRLGKVEREAKSQAKLSQRQQQKVNVSTTTQVEDKLDEVSEMGVERLYGKGWDQQERDRVARQDEEINARVETFTEIAKRNWSTFYPYWNDPLASWKPGKCEKENLPSLPSPVKCPQSHCVGSNTIFEDNDADLFLPDVGDDF